MSPCCHGSPASGIGRCFSHFSRRYTRRYARRGLEPTQKQLVAGLHVAGFEGRSLLDIGCGVGYLHQHLLQNGAETAVGVDVSAAMLAEARLRAGSQGLGAKTRYVDGDFCDIAPGLDVADITVLDKVVCCYPDAPRLLNAAISRTRTTCALTLPRRHLINRVAARMGSGLLRLVGSGYRPFVHDPRLVAQRMREAGFVCVFEARTVVWLTRVYQRPVSC